MSFAHNETLMRLAFQFAGQLDRARWVLRINMGRVRRLDEVYYIPDLFVFPLASAASLMQHPDNLEVYDTPMSLIVEIWSPSTDAYDADAKLPEYRRRGDLEIWRIHPLKQTLMVWRRQPKGAYDEAIYTGGTIAPVAIPGVVIDLDALFSSKPAT
jgi:Uma2 family endonuclease